MLPATFSKLCAIAANIAEVPDACISRKRQHLVGKVRLHLRGL